MSDASSADEAATLRSAACALMQDAVFTQRIYHDNLDAAGSIPGLAARQRLAEVFTRVAELSATQRDAELLSSVTEADILLLQQLVHSFASASADVDAAELTARRNAEQSLRAAHRFIGSLAKNTSLD